PRNKLVVITGLSGSGKSSLAFDTNYAAGQRRYIETFGAYSRQFLGSLERPDVDKISGLSPVISIEQKTTSRNPRSTVGTVTEIYDFMRLLFARIADAYSYHTGEPMVKMSEDEIIRVISERFEGQAVNILAPVVKGRKGHYRELFEQIRKQGYLKVRVDGEIRDVVPKMQADRYKIHDIEIVVDRLEVNPANKRRLADSVRSAMKQAKGIIKVADASGAEFHYSKFLMCPTTGLSYDEPQPNTFSFNSPYGACPLCGGLGYVMEIDENSVSPDPSVSIMQGGLAPLGVDRQIWIFQILQGLGKKYNFSLGAPLGKLRDEVKQILLHGTDEIVPVEVSYNKDYKQAYQVHFDGIIKMLEEQQSRREDDSGSLDDFRSLKTCPSCEGARLKKESLHFRVLDKNIHELACMDIRQLDEWFAS